MQRSDFDQLARFVGSPSVSIYMPTHRAGREVEGDPHRLKNLVRTAAERAAESGFAAKETAAIVAPARALVEREHIWSQSSDGLALFAGPGFYAEHRVPRAFVERALVADRFYLKPLLPMISGDVRYFVLAVSQNRTRLFEGSRFRFEECKSSDLPESLAHALAADHPQKSLQSHTAGGPGSGRASFHGQGVGQDAQKDRLLRYFRQIDRGIRHRMASERHAPLVLAAVEYSLPIYREANTYPRLLNAMIRGNPDGLDARELHHRSWRIVESLGRADEDALAARIQQAVGTGMASTAPGEIVQGAVAGRVEGMLVALDDDVWGCPDASGTAPPELHERRRAGDIELLDFAAVAALTHGGAVYGRPIAEMPDGVPAAALFRY